jgi:hypothetical protein
MSTFVVSTKADALNLIDDFRRKVEALPEIVIVRGELTRGHSPRANEDGLLVSQPDGTWTFIMSVAGEPPR